MKNLIDEKVKEAGSTFQPENLDCPYFGKCQMKKQEWFEQELNRRVKEVKLKAANFTKVEIVLLVLALMFAIAGLLS